ncbi:MAG: tRNA preQ1(34) S-adenosylmethionine ribosyltransferase-isomerase QueA [Gammaproteobacteria bacterium]|nr:tRNA preQ1(34) S-adenosylmethionine ribosyltransferase-isomerase QueA [Gammaproteobacteria bacterium]
MELADFRYHLPAHLIAKYPSPRRTESRLLHVPAVGGFVDTTFAALAGWLQPGDVLVLNDTRVMAARLTGRKRSGGAVEVLLERVEDDAKALAHIKSNRSPKPGSELFLANTPVRVVGRRDDLFVLQLIEGSWPELIETHGQLPLPPYLERAADEIDAERYQTVYARRCGAVAAPTAGLHFDEALLERLEARGVSLAYVTLHVGAGTFQPVRAEGGIHGHKMHAEWLEVSSVVCDQVCIARERGGRVVAVGTTVVRALETAAVGGTLEPYSGDTRLFVTPGFEFRVVDALVTNFHLPATTLMMLVAAFAGRERILAAYRHAVEQQYRFFSYGDAMFLERSP